VNDLCPSAKYFLSGTVPPFERRDRAKPAGRKKTRRAAPVRKKTRRVAPARKKTRPAAPVRKKVIRPAARAARKRSR